MCIVQNVTLRTVKRVTLKIPVFAASAWKSIPSLKREFATVKYIFNIYSEFLVDL